jgi:hypothetical protein
MAESTPLLDEKQWLDGRTLTFEGETEGLRAPTAELEATLELRAEATSAVPEEEDSEAEAGGVQGAGECAWLLLPLQMVATVQP